MHRKTRKKSPLEDNEVTLLDGKVWQMDSDASYFYFKSNWGKYCIKTAAHKIDKSSIRSKWNASPTALTGIESCVLMGKY